MKLLTILLASITICSAARVKKRVLLDEDESLKDACQHYGAMDTYVPSKALSLHGPKCTFTFNIPTSSESEAREMCSIYVPWVLNEATHGKQTICKVEATLRCDPGWVQMFGYCYKLFSQKKYTHSMAQQECSEERARIARFHNKYQVGVWRRTFPTISQVWLNPSEAFDRFIVPINKSSSAVGLAFTGKHFNFLVNHNSLVRINEDWKLQTLCEYRPNITLAHARWRGEKLSEIYYPFVNIDYGVLMRSSSYYTRPADYNKICRGILFAARTIVRASFHPEKESLDALSEIHPVSFARGAAVAILDSRKMKTSKKCVEDVERYEVPNVFKDYANFAIKFTAKNEPDHRCDNLRSTAFMHKKDSVEIRSMSDAQPAPIYCKFGFTKQFEYEQIPGWTVIPKPDGTAAAHKWFKEKKMWADAMDACKKENAVLSGFDSFKEMEMLIELIPDAKMDPSMAVDERRAWLGAYRKRACRRQVFSMDPSNECYRNKVFEWQNKVATAPIDNSMWLNGFRESEQNPDNHGYNQLCMVIIRDRNQKWAPEGQTGNLDDVGCRTAVSYFCQKPAKLLQTGYVYHN